MHHRRIVMISSTMLDLREHREAVRLACLRADFEPRWMMEHLTAEDEIPVDVSLRMVDEADIYIGVFGHRYGYIPKGSEISITEMEYQRAAERGKPCMIFFMHNEHPITIDDVDTGHAAEMLKTFKARIGEERVTAFFKSKNDLRAHVIEALTRLGKKFDADERGDPVFKSSAVLHRRTSIPRSPEPYIAHPYTLLQLRELIGRQDELNLLTDWVADPQSKAYDARIVSLVAIGGMGKSALAWKWFNQIAPNEMNPLAGRLWWSFYESDAAFETFLIRALCYVSGDSEEEVRALPWSEREARLLGHLNEEPYLLVLDGLERILIAYHRMDASYLADDEYDELTANWVAGAVGLPLSAAQSFIGQHRLRHTTDPRAGAFLQKLAQVDASRILMTTRLYPWALQLPTGNPCPACLPYFLRGLNEDNALSLWRKLGVSGARGDLVPLFRSIEGHPLLVQALASEIATYRKAPGDLTEWRRDHPQFDPTNLPLIKSRTHILAFALEGLSTKIQAVLRTLIGFRMPASYSTLEALLVGQYKPCVSAKDLDRALTELEDRGLIGWDRSANRYDAHPVVRGVVWQLATSEDKRAIFAAMESHFKPMAIPEANEVESLADLAPAIELYHALIELGRRDDAFELFDERLSEATGFRLAANHERIMLLERLFDGGPDNASALANDNARISALGQLMFSYQNSGQPGRAIPLAPSVDKIIKSKRKITKAGINLLLDHGYALRQVGALRNAEIRLRQALRLSRRKNYTKLEGLILNILGRIKNTKGEYNLQFVALKRSIAIFTKLKHRERLGLTSADLSDWALTLGDAARASKWAAQARDLARDRRYAYDLIFASLLQGRVAKASCDYSRADEYLHYALTRSRVVRQVEPELQALITLAELELQRNLPSGARSRLEDVWEAAEHGPYPLRLADAYNVLAEIEITEGNLPAAIAAAIKAYKAAWCDGPPYAYHWGLKKAKAHLAALGAPEPEMPPFDESNFEPLPEVEINPKDEFWVDPNALD